MSYAAARRGVTKRCECCNGEFYVQPYRAKTARFCSRSCLAKVHLKPFPAVYGLPRSNEPAHKYKTVTVDGKQVREHRHLMELSIGRKLTPDEHVHHVNGDSLDNRLENLEILTNAEHQRLELRRRRQADAL